MSSSTRRTSPIVERGRILRDGSGDGLSADLTDLDLADFDTRRLDPARIDEAVAAGFAAGRDEGHRAGYADGLAEGRAEAVREAAAQRSRFEALMSAVAAQVDALGEHEAALLRSCEARVSDMALELAEIVIGREVRTATDPGSDAIARSLALVPRGTAEATARLHPDDAARLAGESAGEALGHGIAVRIVADDGLAPGDCVLEAGPCTIDARIGPALARARAALEAAP